MQQTHAILAVSTNGSEEREVVGALPRRFRELTRNSVYDFAHNGVLGYPVAKRIQLPKR